ncbi:cell surface glycoprotein MUC18 isoform X1 [Elgaria multicarinata webbii]|uniref:cell surface glycoprotein MUC18 isoform X1 n=1 Tax=Elgaria multicarinata webbii TaxID=159646 RepID=UPI002FCD3828
MDQSTRTKIIGMLPGKVHHEKTEFKDRLNMTANFSLIIHKVTLQDAKVYVCQVGLGSAGVGENRAELNVFKTPEMPEILETDDRITASDSKTHKIGKCMSRNGFPAPTITWYKDDEPLSPDGKEIEIRPAVTRESSGLISVSSTLSAQVTKEDRDAHFYCQVSYSLMGTNQTFTSKSFKINVHYPSENISFEMEAPSPVKEGDNVTLRCKADGNPEPEYTLFALVDEEEEALPTDISGKEVFFQDIQRDKSGIYGCRALDLQTLKDLVERLELFVNYLDAPIIIPEHPRNLKEGDNLLLTCNATSSKPLEFQWEKKGQVIAKGNLLNLNNVTYHMSGNYTCVATMVEEPRLSGSKQVSVGVHAKPQLAPQKELLFVRKGQKLNLTCSVFSVVKPKFSWKPGNGTIHFSNLNHQHNSTITVMVTEELLDSGMSCTAKNKEGKAERHFRLEQMPEETDPTKRPEPTTQESKGVIIVAVIICILALSILGAVLYFLHKKGKLPCGHSGKQEMERDTSI